MLNLYKKLFFGAIVYVAPIEEASCNVEQENQLETKPVAVLMGEILEDGKIDHKDKEKIIALKKNFDADCEGIYSGVQEGLKKVALGMLEDRGYMVENQESYDALVNILSATNSGIKLPALNDIVKLVPEYKDNKKISLMKKEEDAIYVYLQKYNGEGFEDSTDMFGSIDTKTGVFKQGVELAQFFSIDDVRNKKDNTVDMNDMVDRL